MKGYRFYLEYNSNKAKRAGNHTGNVFAAMLDDNGRPLYLPGGANAVEGIGAVFFTPNSGVAGTSASVDYLRTKCKRVSEAKAREIHPNMFKVLDG